MQETVKRRATYADLEAVPEHLVAEILHGRLVTHPQPTGEHGEVHFSLGLLIGAVYRQGIGTRGGWRFINEPELHFNGDVAVPELAGWRIERLPVPPAPDPLKPVKIRLAPDWVCEVLSPSTEKYDRGDKRDIYAEGGVRYLWLVDPRIETLEAFEFISRRWTLIGTYQTDAVFRAAPFEDLEINLGQLWPPVPATRLAPPPEDQST